MPLSCEDEVAEDIEGCGTEAGRGIAAMAAGTTNPRTSSTGHPTLVLIGELLGMKDYVDSGENNER